MITDDAIAKLVEVQDELTSALGCECVDFAHVGELESDA